MRHPKTRRAWQRDLPALAIVEMIPEITADARALLQRHALRAGDAIQLASCAYLQRQLGQRVPFVAFDRRLLAAAQAEGLTVITAASGRHRKGEHAVEMVRKAQRPGRGRQRRSRL